MTDSERAAFQSILAEKIKDSEHRHSEIRRGLEARIADLETENTHLERQVKFLARELEKQGYAFTAEDWMAMAERETRVDIR